MNIVTLIFLLSCIISISFAFITSIFCDSTGGGYKDNLNQGRIYGIKSWGLNDQERVTSFEFESDAQTAFTVIGWGSPTTNCGAMSLAEDDYIYGYRVICGCCAVKGITFYAKNSGPYPCMCSTCSNIQSDTGIQYEPGYYVAGFEFRSGQYVDGISFQFEPLSTPTKAPTNAPTGSINSVVWGNSNHVNYQPVECLPNTATTDYSGRAIGVQCCTNDGSAGSRPGCIEAVTFNAAYIHCKSESKRLCTRTEIESGKGATSGCGFDGYHVWSSTECDSISPSPAPTLNPTPSPTNNPTPTPTNDPTLNPTPSPTNNPTTTNPTNGPTNNPSKNPTDDPTKYPTNNPSESPSTNGPTNYPTKNPSHGPTKYPSNIATKAPTLSPVSDGEYVGISTTDSSQERKTGDEVTGFLEKYPWIYVGIGSLFLVLTVVIFIVFRRAKQKQSKHKQIQDKMKSIQSLSNCSNMTDIEHMNNYNETEKRLERWLESIGMSQHLNVFIKEGFGEDMSHFMSLSMVTDDQLKSIGIKNLSHRILILSHIQSLNAKQRIVGMEGGNNYNTTNRVIMDDGDSNDDDDQLYVGVHATDNGEEATSMNDIDDDEDEQIEEMFDVEPKKITARNNVQLANIGDIVVGINKLKC